MAPEQLKGGLDRRAHRCVRARRHALRVPPRVASIHKCCQTPLRSRPVLESEPRSIRDVRVTVSGRDRAYHRTVPAEESRDRFASAAEILPASSRAPVTTPSSGASSLVGAIIAGRDRIVVCGIGARVAQSRIGNRSRRLRLSVHRHRGHRRRHLSRAFAVHREDESGVARRRTPACGAGEHRAGIFRISGFSRSKDGNSRRARPLAGGLTIARRLGSRYEIDVEPATTRGAFGTRRGRSLEVGLPRWGWGPTRPASRIVISDP